MTQSLGEFKPGESGRVLRILPDGDGNLSTRIREMGFVEGEGVEVLFEAPFVGDPIAVRVRGALIGIRRSEAKRILVTRNTK